MEDNKMRICSVDIGFEFHAYRTPIKFGGNAVNDATLLNVRVTGETRSGKRAEGTGSIPLGNVWSWPPRNVKYEDSLKAMKLHAEKVRDILLNCKEWGHPVELATGMEEEWLKSGQKTSSELGLSEPMPKLCVLVTASAFDAALHDSYGKIFNKNVYDCYGPEYMNRDISAYLDSSFKGEFLDRYTLRKPKEILPLYHLIGALDPLTAADVKKPVGDGLPETLPEWIKHDGLRYLKVKLNGDDLNWDMDRVVSVERVVSQTQAALGVKTWHYSLDFNERCANVDYLLDFLAKVKEKSPSAMDGIQYIEQPTARDLRSHPENKMHNIAAIKPVVIDESLVDYGNFLLAREQGYSGVALKSCKGQSQALLMGAAAQKFKMFLCTQDLTCPGESFLHSAGLTARIPTAAAVEGNARQFLPPSANGKWAKKYPEIFNVKEGMIRTGVLTGPGLGH
jgi:L-alanine-DL-glutamate epimerase-like enolase superfamily enzyme